MTEASGATRRAPRSQGRRPLKTLVVAVVLVGWILGSLRLIFWPVEIKGYRPQDVGDMVLLPGGVLRSRAPTREFPIAPFFMDRFEVTRREYAQFLKTHPERPRPPGFSALGEDATIEEDERPVTWVTWFDAQAFAIWRGKRLPTFEEWQWAAGGLDGTEFPWGMAVQHLVANTAELDLEKPTPVGLFDDGRTSRGIYDLVGNVAEWTATPAGVVFPDRYFVLGGSFRDRLFVAGDEADFMVTHVWSRLDASDPNDAPAWHPLERVLKGPAFSSGGVGFRCVEDAPPQQVWQLIEDLGYRDPLGYLMHTLPAMRELRRIGRPCVRHLEQAAQEVDQAGVRERLVDLARQIRDGS